MKKTIFTLSLMFLAFISRGDTIVFNTFGPGDTYNQGAGYAVAHTPPGLTESAAQFTAGVSGNLTTVDLGLTYAPAFTPEPVNVFLYGNVSGAPDNANQTLLGTATPTSAFLTTNNSVISFNVAGTVSVTMGATYWLVLKPAVSGEFDVWNSSLPPVIGTLGASYNDSTWNDSAAVLPAFRLSALSATSAVPDSGGTILLLLGSVLTLFVLQRIKLRTTTNHQVGKPEGMLL